MKCEKCGKTIPKERIKALPETKFCVNCSEEKSLVGLITESEIVIVNHDEAERLKKLRLAGPHYY